MGQPGSLAETKQRGARDRRRASRVPVGDEFAARLWSSNAGLGVLPVVNLSADGMLLASTRRVAVVSVRVELIGRMWRIVGRARVVGHAERCVRLHVIAWEGRARERIEEYVTARLLA